MTELRSPHRIVVLGTSASGKSTFARDLSQKLDCPHVELDALHWQKGWVGKDKAAFFAEVDAVTLEPRWVIEGGYRSVRDLIWTRATTAIWLDYSFPVVFAWALHRTVDRVFTGKEVHNGNRETFRHAFLSLDGIPWWVLRTHHRRRREYRRLLARFDYSHLQRIMFHRPREAAHFLAVLGYGVANENDGALMQTLEFTL